MSEILHFYNQNIWFTRRYFRTNKQFSEAVNIQSVERMSISDSIPEFFRC